MNGEEKKHKSSDWVGLVAVAMVCVTVVAIVYLVWGQC